ncbi:PEP-CTERM sorting domain-containing protein [Oxalobacteraceae bacterium]|nr:PEP-CTERM sorting domain-containing protein [Oxalobacteraceae bacterium]
MKSMIRVLSIAALLLAAQNTLAVTLTPGMDTPLPGTTVAAEPQLAGMVLEDDVQGFSFTGSNGIVSGTVQSRVVRSVDGTLDFYWRVNSDRSSSGDIGALRIGEFIAPEYNANWRIDGLGSVMPANARMFINPSPGYFNFLFDAPNNPLGAGMGSYFMFMDTSATSYAKNAVYDLTGDGNISTLYATFAPAVPEPATYAMTLLGMACVGMALKRRRG